MNMVSDISSRGAKPTFTIVAAVYGVARYLDDFLVSVANQRGIERDRVQVIAVDDGSVDGSLDILRRWERSGRVNLLVLTKENGGQASARNLGITHATGDWVTFADPDDILHRDYLRNVDRFIAAHPDARLVMGRRVFHHDAGDVQVSRHPLDAFHARDALVDLAKDGNRFVNTTIVSFFPRAVLIEENLLFDEDIRPHFEDGHFAARYLLGCDRPLVGFLSDAIYYYRIRSDGSSALQTRSSDSAVMTNVPRRGYLDLIETAVQRHGRVPQWLQNMVLRELVWYFRMDRELATGLPRGDGAGDEFLDVLARIRNHLDDEVVAAYSASPCRPEWRQMLRHCVHGGQWQPDYFLRLGRGTPVQSIKYRCAGGVPRITISREGNEVSLLAHKVQSIEYFGRVLMHEYTAWFPGGSPVEVHVGNSRLIPLDLWPTAGPPKTGLAPLPSPARTSTDLAQRWSAVIRRRLRRWRDSSSFLADRTVTIGAFLVFPRRRYRGAWVLTEGLESVGDNAEVLFRYVRTARPDVNAWFVVARTSVDWARLRAEFPGRVVARDSRKWVKLMAHCQVLISSTADDETSRPERIVRLSSRAAAWHFVYLGDGIITDDVSRWLNLRRINLLVTSSPAEHEAIVADGSPYRFSTYEVTLSGMPRLDALWNAMHHSEPSRILLAPQTSMCFSGRLDDARLARGDRDHEPENQKAWSRLVHSAVLADMGRNAGIEIAVIVPREDGDEYRDAPVSRVGFTAAQRSYLLASSQLVVTDDMATACDAAFLGIPVVHVRFNRIPIFGDGHGSGPGYFNMERDGFGPVVDSVEQVLAAVSESIASGFLPDARYRNRMEQTFVLRDGQCCARIIAAIEARGMGARPRSFVARALGKARHIVSH